MYLDEFERYPTTLDSWVALSLVQSPNIDTHLGMARRPKLLTDLVISHSCRINSALPKNRYGSGAQCH